MRSRFTAYAAGDWDYLWRTLHPSHADRQGPKAEWRVGAEAGGRGVSFRGLKVLDVGPEDGDGFAHVLFAVNVFVGREDASFIEHSRFAKDGNGWRYVDGKTLPRAQVKARLYELDIAQFDDWAGPA